MNQDKIGRRQKDHNNNNTKNNNNNNNEKKNELPFSHVFQNKNKRETEKNLSCLNLACLPPLE